MTRNTNLCLWRNSNGFSKWSFFRKNDQAASKALTLNYDDQEKLKKVLFDECNWFDFLYKKNTSQTWEDLEGDECFSYDQALKNAIDALNDDEFWEQFSAKIFTTFIQTTSKSITLNLQSLENSSFVWRTRTTIDRN